MDYFLEMEEIDLFLLTIENMRKFFLNIYLVTEVERKNIRQYKVKFMDGIVIYILLLISDRTEKLRNLLQFQ